MKRNLVWFLAGILFSIAGIFCLRLFVGARPLPDSVANQNAARAYGLVANLDCLRRGDTNSVIERFEAELDSRIVDIPHDLDSPHEVTKQHLRRALEIAKEYRKKFPRTTINPQVDKEVEKALSKVK